MLTLIFGTANPQEVALAFLHSDARRRGDRQEGGPEGTALTCSKQPSTSTPDRRRLARLRRVNGWGGMSC